MSHPVQIVGGPSDDDQPLPGLREDLQMFRGPDEPDGSPGFSLFDPVRSQYFKITWPEMLVVRHLRKGMTLRELTDTINEHSTLNLSADEVKGFFQDAQATGLLATRRTSEILTAEFKKKHLNPFVWLMYYYLFIRVPLINPDRFLNYTIGWVKMLFHPKLLIVYGVFALAGMMHLLLQFDDFIHTFPYFFNAKGFVIYALAIFCIKVIHEFSHAYVAKYYDVRVPRMGVLFMVLWPVLFTDVTDAWRLPSRKQRLAISVAGVAVELLLAGLSTLGWALTEPGLLQSVFFIIASATWLSTLLVNINPALRFDGYYLLTDILGVDNLQGRSFAITRWQLRKWILGVDVPPPEEGLLPKTQFWMMVYSVYTWIYRIFLYTAIAVLVYYKFTKVLGAFLFIVEIILFLGWPIYSELKQLGQMLPFIHVNKRVMATVIVLTLALAWVALPLSRTERFSAITTPVNAQVVYVPHDSRVEALHVRRGDSVIQGQTLAELSSKPLDSQIALVQLDLKEIKAQMDIASLVPRDRALLPRKQAEIRTVEEQLRGLGEMRKRLRIVAEVAGEVSVWDENLAVGQHVTKDQVLGRVAKPGDIEVECFVPEALLSTISEGQGVEFWVAGNLKTVQGTVKTINPSRAHYLEYPALASVYAGDLPVMPSRDNRLNLVESYYIVTITLSDIPEDLRFGHTGEVFAAGPRRSRLVSVFRYVLSIFWRESGF